ncbi:MAG: hypothetical protein IPK50_04850 [Fibrobacterota bacterium]|nr:MAG: hypothetical protein IPK50_04850 [Fibrobacterota bacterium]
MAAILRPWLRRTLILLVGLVCVWCLRGAIFRLCVSYHPIGERAIPPRTPAVASAWFYAHGFIFSDPEVLADRALDFTDDHLVYRFSRTSSDPDRLLESHRAHCVGYALLCASAIRTGLASSGLDKNWSVHARVVKLSLFGVDVHPYLPGAFFRDHDVVELREKSSGRSIWLDPSLHEVVGIDRIRAETKNRGDGM